MLYCLYITKLKFQNKSKLFYLISFLKLAKEFNVTPSQRFTYIGTKEVNVTPQRFTYIGTKEVSVTPQRFTYIG